MKAIYQHCAMFGSHNVPCTILDERVWKPQYRTSIEKDFGMKHTVESQYLISYYDSLEGELVEKWVNDCYVKVGNV